MTKDRISLEGDDEALLLRILKIVKEIRFGYVQIVVQDSKAVQIDKVEKIRLDNKT